MPTRREFLKISSAAGMAVASSPDLAWTAGRNNRRTSQTAPIPPIKSVVRREDTTLRLGGMGDNYHMSWGADDRQFVAVCDGLGWSKQPNAFYNSRLYAITGGPHDATFEEVPGYPELADVLNTENTMRYYGFGTVALRGRIYQYLSTPNYQFTQEGSIPAPGARFIGAKLIFSPDNGHTWCNQDGSSPVLWEPWRERSRKNMVFWEEPQDAFSLLSILQMGRGYQANKDGYVYVYSPNGSVDGSMNELVMFRVSKKQVINRDAYEYFAGLKRGQATWTADMRGRAIVHTFPRGWVNSVLHPYAWMPSVTYNEPLGVYMMASWGTASAPDGRWFAKASYLGLWISQVPWGPWIQIYEDTAWTPQGNAEARAFAPQISPKWIAQDGKSLWLVWADFQSNASEAEMRELKAGRASVTDREGTVKYYQRVARAMPYYSFNTQRIDLVM